MKEELRMKCFGTDCGVCGKKAPFKDSNGDTLYTGDVVVVFNKKHKISFGKIPIIEANGEIFVMGIYTACPNYEKEWKIYKEKSYKSMKDGDIVERIYYTNNNNKKINSLEELEKELDKELYKLIEILEKILHN